MLLCVSEGFVVGLLLLFGEWLIGPDIQLGLETFPTTSQRRLNPVLRYPSAPFDWSTHHPAH